MNCIETSGLCKAFANGKIKAVKPTDLKIGVGERFGFIGPDGAGKTTLFRLLCTLLLPDSGNAKIMGLDIREDFSLIRQQTGYMPGKFSLYTDLSVEENLTFFASVFGCNVRSNYDLIKPIYEQLEPFKKRRAGNLSGGMKQKLALCCALIHRPPLLILDEPTTGVDVISRYEFWEILKNLKQFGITILVSTPYMDEAEKCERIALMENGEILVIDSPANITSGFPHQLFAVRAKKMGALLAVIKEHPWVSQCYSFGAYHHVYFTNSQKENLFAEEIKKLGFEDVEIKPTRAGIEDCFMNLMREKTEINEAISGY